MTCEHIHAGSIHAGGADLDLCGKPARRQVDMQNSAYGGRRRGLVPVCGIHGNFWKNRGYTVTPLADSGTPPA